MSNEYILSRSVWNTLNLVYFNGPCGFAGKISNTGYNNPTQTPPTTRRIPTRTVTRDWHRPFSTTV